MKTFLLAAVLALVPQGQDTGTFTDTYLGLAFNHPKTWTVLKKTKDMTRYSIPIDGSASMAELEIIRSPFHASKDIWQTIQLRANETLHREVVRQWEQDVIDVPVLFTQVNWTDKGNAKTTLSGLYYTRTPLKMLVRLTAPAGDYEKVRYEFQTALETLHTTNGVAPKVDDEAVKFEPTAKPQPAPIKPTIIDAGNREGKVFKGPVTVPLTVSTKAVVLRLPEGWKAEDVQEGRLVLRHAKLSAPITVEVRSTLDSEPASTALLKKAAAGLADFEPGVRREDTNPKPNRGGCAVSTVWRIGKGGGGDLFTYDATGQQSDFYFLASYRTTSASAYKDDRKLIRELFEGIALEAPQP